MLAGILYRFLLVSFQSFFRPRVHIGRRGGGGKEWLFVSFAFVVVVANIFSVVVVISFVFAKVTMGDAQID